MIDQFREMLDECLILHDYSNCVCWLFGISRNAVPLQAKLWEKLQELVQKLDQAEHAAHIAETRHLKRVAIKIPDSWHEGLQSIRPILEQNRQIWKSGLRILCSDDELRRIALKVKDEGRVSFSKAEFEERFGLVADDPFLRYVPDYTRFFVGGGLSFSSPEYDMYRAMCCCHDRAVLTGRELEEFRQHVLDNLDEQGFVNFERSQGVVHVWELSGRMGELVASHHHEVRQVVVNACLFVEAFVNSIAHAYRCKPAKPLSPEDGCYLRERAIDKQTGAEREKFVSLQDKLHRWVQLVSPRGETFDKGANPYQAWRSVQEYRDSIVHLSATKIQKYHRIDLAVAMQAVDVALEIVQAVCRYIAPNSTAVAYPKWLAQRQPDGLFHLSASIELLPQQGETEKRTTNGQE